MDGSVGMFEGSVEEQRLLPVVRVLLVEDNSGDARLVAALLGEETDVRFELSTASTLAAALASGGPFDLILTDVGLPDSQGERTVDAVLRAWPDTPVVVLTGKDDRRTGIYAVQRGCQDFLIKGFSDGALLSRTIRYAIERAAAARALRESESRFRSLADVSPDAILLCADNGVVFVNMRAVAIFHAAGGSDLVGIDPRTLCHPIDLSRLMRALRSLKMGESWQEACRIECQLVRLDGGSFDAEVTFAPIVYKEHSSVQMVVRDISGRKVAERQHHLASVVFETTAEAIMVTDDDNRIIAVNPAFERVTGYGLEEIVGHNPKHLSSGRHDRDFYVRMWDCLRRTGHWHGEVWNRRKNGEIYVQRLTLSLIRDGSGAIVNHVGVFSDITDEKQEEERIRYRASYDALTGLPNRSLLYDRLLQALANTQREYGELGVLFLDIDGFKPVNDLFGHLAGDQLLVALSERLQGCVRESDTVARLGGDEFVIILPSITNARDAELVASKILAIMSRPFQLDFISEPVLITASIGIALYPRHGCSAEVLLSYADRAMYDAKQAGKGRFAFAQGPNVETVQAGGSFPPAS